MKKHLVVVYFALFYTIGLFGEFSINESPNGYVYNPTYVQCESFSNVPVLDEDITIENAFSNPSLSSTIIRSSPSQNDFGSVSKVGVK